MRFRKPLRGQSGAFDLPSILVGVVTVGFLTVGILVAIFGVIPFAQDNAARQDLGATRPPKGPPKPSTTGTATRIVCAPWG
jgi:hypothetical protein